MHWGVSLRQNRILRPHGNGEYQNMNNIQKTHLLVEKGFF